LPGTQLNLSAPERAVLVAPDRVARAAATVMLDAQQRWILRQPRDVRRSFATEVVTRGGGDPVAQERWMLLQDDVVRHSYVHDVLDAAGPTPAGDRQQRWPAVAAGLGAAVTAVAGIVWLLGS
jgi:hypothetical protein